MLSMWVIYDHPFDYPDSFVARRWEVGSAKLTATSDVIFGDTLNSVRLLLPPGLSCIKRAPDDVKQIVETWL